MSSEHRGPATKALDKMILMKLCPLLVALFICLSVTLGQVPEAPKYVNATVGEDVVLFCGFEFYENKSVRFEVQWYKQGIKEPIYIRYADHPPRSGVGYEGRLSLTHQASLHLLQVHETDQGWYDCKVYFRNRPPPFYTQKYSRVYLDVYEKSKRVSPTVGEHTILFYDFEYPDNKPEPYFAEWLKKDTDDPIYAWAYKGFVYLGVGYESRLSLAHQASLSITNVRESDRGWYQLKVFFLNPLSKIRKKEIWVYLDVNAAGL